MKRIIAIFCVLSLLIFSQVAVAEDAKNGLINGTVVNVRAAAGIETDNVLFKLTAGEKVTITKSSGDWYYIESAKGKGWVAAWLVTLESQASGSAREGYIKGSVVNIRKEPSTTAERITQLVNGQKVNVLDQHSGWYKIRLGDGREGWVAEDLLSFAVPGTSVITPPEKPVAPSVPIGTETTILVTGNPVNLRKGPGLNYDRIGQVKAGTELVSTGKSGDWLRVKYASGEAWIASWLTVEKKTPGPAPVQPTTPEVPGTTEPDKPSEPAPIDKTYGNVSIREKVGEIEVGLDKTKKLLIKNSGDKIKFFILGVAKNDAFTAEKSEDGKTLNIELAGLNMGKQNLNDAADVLAKWEIESVELDGELLSFTLAKDFDFKAVHKTSGVDFLETEITFSLANLARIKKIDYQLRDRTVTLEIPIDKDKEVNYSVRNTAADRFAVELRGAINDLSASQTNQQKTSGPVRNIKVSQFKPDTALLELVLVAGTKCDIVKESNKLVITATQVGGSLAGRTIVIDPGHGAIQPGGWTDPGAIGRILGVKEVDVNLDMALRTRDRLEGLGAKVIMTHSTGRTYLSLAGRADVANAVNADVFISIHANANENPEKDGTSVYYYAPTWHELAVQRGARVALASAVQRETVKAGGRKDLGIFEENFAVLRETRVPSILVETAFLSNPIEEQLLNTADFRQRMAEGIANGLVSYFGN